MLHFGRLLVRFCPKHEQKIAECGRLSGRKIHVDDSAGEKLVSRRAGSETSQTHVTARVHLHKAGTVQTIEATQVSVRIGVNNPKRRPPIGLSKHQNLFHGSVSCSPSDHPDTFRVVMRDNGAEDKSPSNHIHVDHNVARRSIIGNISGFTSARRTGDDRQHATTISS